MPNHIPNIFDYFDYRAYLQDYYNARKQHETGFSHRSFLASAAIKGTVYLQRILTNQRDIAESFIPNFITALSLSGREAEYFVALVNFCNHTDGLHKERFMKQMLSLRTSCRIHRMQDRKLRFFEKWYYPVIRELMTFVDFGDDYSQLACRVIPRITAAQAQGAVSYLIENGFISKNELGRYAYSTPLISSGDKVKSTLLRGYHRRVLQQCSDALDTVPSQQRDITSLTLGVSAQTYERIKEEIRQFRQHLLAIAEEDPSPEMVCLVGFQLIPRTTSPSQKAKKS
jgi:uncharacterized protein (TIGR02147 family)